MSGFIWEIYTTILLSELSDTHFQNACFQCRIKFFLTLNAVRQRRSHSLNVEAAPTHWSGLQFILLPLDGIANKLTRS